MALEVHESHLSQSTIAFHTLLESYGGSRMTEMELLSAANTLYKSALEDPVLTDAAFGMAVALISNNLKISLRSAALILTGLVDLR